MSGNTARAVRILRAALGRVWPSQSRQTRTVHSSVSTSTTWTASDHPTPDLPALAALAPAGLVHPGDALLIALIEAARRPDP